MTDLRTWPGSSVGQLTGRGGGPTWYNAFLAGGFILMRTMMLTMTTTTTSDDDDNDNNADNDKHLVFWCNNLCYGWMHSRHIERWGGVISMMMTKTDSSLNNNVGDDNDHFGVETNDNNDCKKWWLWWHMRFLFDAAIYGHVECRGHLKLCR